MARKFFTKTKKVKKSRGNREKSILNLAYNMGLVERGLKNPDSKISASYAKGVEKREKREKKTLF